MLSYRRVTHSGIPHLAYTFGRPIIATNVGDFQEIIEEGKSGFVLSSNTQEELSDKLIQAFSDKPKLQAMGKYARDFCATKYSWKDSAESLIPVYKSMVKNK